MRRKHGHIEQSLMPPRTAAERTLFAEIRRCGLSLHRVHADGRAVRVTGPGVHVTVEALHWLKLSDLVPQPPNHP